MKEKLKPAPLGSLAKTINPKIYMKKVLAILGPTATGKTDVALFLAKKYNGELVSCDSRQVYKGLDIGTGKEPGKSIMDSVLRVKKEAGFWEIDGVKIWMYDVVSPDIRCTVKDYVEKATEAVEDIISRGKLPIIVGGTGLYLKGLLYGFPNLDIPVDENLRGELEMLSLKELQGKLLSLSPTRFGELSDSDKKNPRRLIRSVELILMNPYGRTSQISNLKSQRWDVLKIGLAAPRDELQKRIFSRLVFRIDQGLLKEAEKLYKNGVTLQRMKELGLEYGMLAKLLGGEISEDQFIDQLSAKISQYAKRQMTWFKKEPDVNWFDITVQDWNVRIEKTVSSWYHAGI